MSKRDALLYVLESNLGWRSSTFICSRAEVSKPHGLRLLHLLLNDGVIEYRDMPDSPSLQWRLKDV